MPSYGVIFDMDGVLIDSYRAHFLSRRQIARQYGMDLTEEQFRPTFGRTGRDTARLLFPNLSDAQRAAFDAEKEALYRQMVADDFPVMPGAPDLLASLHAAGFRLAIGSSGPPENIALLQRHLPNAHLISAIVTGTEVAHGKPDPEVFLLAARKLDLAPSRCAVLEDAPVGLEAARRAAMVPIALTSTRDRATLDPQADLVIDSLHDLSPHQLAALIRANSARGRAGAGRSE